MAKAVREVDGKRLLFSYFETVDTDTDLAKYLSLPFKAASVGPDTDVCELLKEQQWLQSEVSVWR